MKQALAAAGLTALLATAASAEEKQTADECVFDKLYDIIEQTTEGLQRSLVDQFQTDNFDFLNEYGNGYATSVTLIYSDEQKQQFIADCEEETDTKAFSSRGITKMRIGPVGIEFEGP